MGKVFQIRPRFSLRTMLFAFVVLAVPLSWLAAKVRQAQRQAVAVARVEELGGTVAYDYGYYLLANGEGCIGLGRKPTDWLWLRDHFGDDIVSRVHYIQFGSTGVDDGSRGFRSWDSWFIPTPLSQRADEEMSVLTLLPGLHSLDLRESTVTDRAIPHLAKLTDLRYLRLMYTNVTVEGVARLREALPQCEISWSPPRPNQADGPTGLDTNMSFGPEGNSSRF